MKFNITIILVFLYSTVFAQLLNTSSFSVLNSPYDELQPVLSQDRKTLFFTIANHPQNIGGKKDLGDIWFSNFSGDQWSAPIHGGTLLNDKSYNAVAGISSDGKQLILLGHYNAAGTVHTQGISISKNSGYGWQQPENISIPYFRNKSLILNGYITPDKGVFVFSSETYGTRGVEDIYVCFNEDGKWTEPKNLGSRINTQFQELSPSLSVDGKTLYYSSNGKKGNGSFDVYVANRLDDTWTNWSEPVNLETGINSEGRELFYRVYPDVGFSIYTSTKNSDGYGDINLFKELTELQKNDTIKIELVIDDTVKFKAIKSQEISNTVYVHGKVSNTKTGELVTATLIFSGPSLKPTIKQANGADGYTITIPEKSAYTVKIEASNYISAIEWLDIRNYEMAELEMNFKLQPIEVGALVNLKNVLFERGTSILLPESNSELDLVVAFLKSNPSIKIELIGHTDNRGVHMDNVKLSQERVNKVKQYLIDKGIEQKRLTGKGYGGNKPIASNDTEETRKLNRRVEFIIKKF